MHQKLLHLSSFLPNLASNKSCDVKKSLKYAHPSPDFTNSFVNSCFLFLLDKKLSLGIKFPIDDKCTAFSTISTFTTRYHIHNHIQYAIQSIHPFRFNIYCVMIVFTTQIIITILSPSKWCVMCIFLNGCDGHYAKTTCCFVPLILSNVIYNLHICMYLKKPFFHRSTSLRLRILIM